MGEAHVSAMMANLKRDGATRYIDIDERVVYADGSPTHRENIGSAAQIKPGCGRTEHGRTEHGRMTEFGLGRSSATGACSPRTHGRLRRSIQRNTSFAERFAKTVGHPPSRGGSPCRYSRQHLSKVNSASGVCWRSQY